MRGRHITGRKKESEFSRKRRERRLQVQHTLESGSRDEVGALFSDATTTGDLTAIVIELLSHGHGAAVDAALAPIPEEVASVCERISESVSAARAFTDGALRTRVTIRDYGSHMRAEVELIDPRPVVGAFVWDWVDSDARVAIWVFAYFTRRNDPPLYAREAPPTVPVSPPMWHLFPIRFEHSRQYAVPFAKRFKRDATPPHYGFTMESLNACIGLLSADYNRHALRYPRRRSPDGLPHMVLDAEQALAMAYANYSVRGRQIFVVPQRLRDLLDHTDVEGTPMEAIHAPYPCLYVHLGPMATAELEPGRLADGAFVCVDERTCKLEITVTCAVGSGDAMRPWYVAPEPQFTLVVGVIVFFLQIDTLTHKNSSRDKHLQNRLSRTRCAFGAD